MTQETASGTEVMATVARAVDEASVRKVFGEPIVRDDVTIIPVARVSGGGGGGGGSGTGRPDTPGAAEASGSGSGGGLGVSARPAGVFVVKGGKVQWRPAVDMNKVIMGGQLIALVAVITGRVLAGVKARRGADGPAERQLARVLAAKARRAAEGRTWRRFGR